MPMHTWHDSQYCWKQWQAFMYSCYNIDDDDEEDDEDCLQRQDLKFFNKYTLLQMCTSQFTLKLSIIFT